MKRPFITIVGAGRLGTALERRLSEAGYSAKTLTGKSARARQSGADVLWFCVPDAEIARVANTFSQFQFKGKVAFHSSGVLSSDALISLRNAGGRVASVHPLMTFVKGSVPELNGVPFAIEGDSAAVRVARSIVHHLGGQAVTIKKQDKVAYHAFATMICPLLVSLLAVSEKAAALAGTSAADSRRRMLPIIRQTLRNYEQLGPAAAFSGPIVRGDVETIRAHIDALAKVPAAKHAYEALARAALELLPNRNRRQIARLLE
jgi:predicted short-subunit dehydrogenase-like oxidoreductase (DUF2520 family)